jgi:hypothetical protein
LDEFPYLVSSDAANIADSLAELTIHPSCGPFAESCDGGCFHGAGVSDEVDACATAGVADASAGPSSTRINSVTIFHYRSINF